MFYLQTLIIFLYSSLLFQKTSAIVQCPSSITLGSSSCSTSQIKTSTNLNINSGSTQVCIHQVVYMDSICSQSSDIYFFRAEGKYDGTNYQTIFEFKWSSSSLQMLALDSSGTSSSLFTSMSQAQPTYTTIPYFVCLDFTNQVAYGGINSPSGSESGQVSISDFASLSSLDSVMFYFCNDGTNSASCSFDETRVFYQTSPPSNLNPYLWGVTPTLIRSYEASQGSGSYLLDSTTNQAASFGSDTPYWSKTNYGVEFNDTSQYITIPTFTISPSNPLTYSSFTFSMWIRLISLPSATSYIFRRSSSDLSQDKFVLKIQTDGTIFVTIGSTATFSSAAISTGQWVLISTTLTVKSDYKTYFTSIVIDDTLYAPSTSSSLSTSLTFSSTDKVIMGGPTGFEGTIYKLKLYSPGSHVFPSDSCSSSTTLRSFGLETFAYFYQCNSACEDCFGSDDKSCMACATASEGLYNSECVTCPTTTFMTETLCADCIDNCDECSSFTTCDVCSSGYKKDTDDTCIPDITCIANCDECSTPTTCDVCSSGYKKDTDDTCILDIVCIANCDECATLTTCDVCSSGYKKDSDDTCILDTSSTTNNNNEISSTNKNTASALKAGRTAADATTQVASLTGNGDPVGVQAQVSGKIFISIQYFNITYSQDVLEILAQNAATPGLGSPAYVPNVPGSTENRIVVRNVPYAFNKYGVTSSFIMNFWKKMIFIAIITAALAFAFSLEFVLQKRTLRFLPPAVPPLLRAGLQNFLLTQLYSFLGDVVLFATLQYRTIKFHTTYEWIDFFVSIIFLLVVLSMPVLHYLFINKYRRVRKSGKNEEVLKYQQSNQGCKLFFNDFNDRLRAQQLFLLFLTARDFVFNIILTTMFDHPLPQMIILLIMNLSMIAYLIMKKPFKVFLNFVQQMFYEVLFFMALIILIILTALDMNNSTNNSARDTLGKILIYESFAFTYGTLLITLAKVVLIAIQLYRERRQSKPTAPQLKYLSSEETPCALSYTDNGMSPINQGQIPKKLLTAVKLESDENSERKKDGQETPLTDPRFEISFSEKRSLKGPADLEAKQQPSHRNNKAALSFTPQSITQGGNPNENEQSEVIDQLLELMPEMGGSIVREYKPSMMNKSFKFLKTQEQK